MILANWERFLVKARCPKNYDGCKHTGIYSIINCRISRNVTLKPYFYQLNCLLIYVFLFLPDSVIDFCKLTTKDVM